MFLCPVLVPVFQGFGVSVFDPNPSVSELSLFFSVWDPVFL